MARSTAEGACALRAAGTTLRDPEIRNPDYMAKDFIAPGLKVSALAKVPLLRRLSPRIIERILPGALWFELARTRHMDDVLLSEVADGATQVVLLGAGLDSRCYRLRDELGDAALFEVDHPVTAAVKAERLEAIFGEHARARPLRPRRLQHPGRRRAPRRSRLRSRGPLDRAVVGRDAVPRARGRRREPPLVRLGHRPGQRDLLRLPVEGDAGRRRLVPRRAGAAKARRRREASRSSSGSRAAARRSSSRASASSWKRTWAPRTRTSGSSTTPASPTASAAWRSSGTHAS